MAECYRPLEVIQAQESRLSSAGARLLQGHKPPQLSQPLKPKAEVPLYHSSSLMPASCTTFRQRTTSGFQLADHVWRFRHFRQLFAELVHNVCGRCGSSLERLSSKLARGFSLPERM